MSRNGKGAKEEANDTSTTVAVTDPVFKVGEMDEFVSFEQAIEFLSARGVDLIPANEVLGDGFDGVEKAELLNKVFVIMKVTKTVGKQFNVPMVIIHAITREGRRVRFSDGSTGIRDQLAMFQERYGRNGVGMVVNGLVDSTYTVMQRDDNGMYVRDENGDPIPFLQNGKEIKGTTYYLSTEPVK